MHYLHDSLTNDTYQSAEDFLEAVIDFFDLLAALGEVSNLDDHFLISVDGDLDVDYMPLDELKDLPGFKKWSAEELFNDADLMERIRAKVEADGFADQKDTLIDIERLLKDAGKIKLQEVTTI